MEQIFKQIRDLRGEAAFSNGKMLIGLFNDLSREKKDLRILRYFVECDGHSLLLAAKNLSPAMQQARFVQVVNKICTETLVSEDVAQSVCRAFWTAVYGTSMDSPKSQPPATTQKSVPPPARTASTTVRTPAAIDPDLEISGKTVVRYKGNKATVQIPDEIEIIGEKAFFSNKTITKVYLPESLRHIAESAFRCPIREIVLPDSVETIGTWAFEGTRLACVVLPRGIKIVDAWAFSECQQLRKVVFTRMPEELHPWAFSNCKNLEEIIFPKGGESMFAEVWCSLGANFDNRGSDFYKGTEEEQVRTALSFKYYWNAAQLGSAEAQFRIGVRYKYGHGVEADLQEAIKWYRKAAEQNHKTACEVLSMLYAKGEGVPWNPIEARKWKKKAGY